MSKQAKNRVTIYFQDALEEYRKITWPTNQQTALLTAVVVVVSLLMAALIGFTDLGLSQLYQLLLNTLT